MKYVHQGYKNDTQSSRIQVNVDIDVNENLIKKSLNCAMERLLDPD